jgi:hypothetical protein
MPRTKPEVGGLREPQPADVPVLERIIMCEYCDGPGVEIGTVGDSLSDLVECIKALHEQNRLLMTRIQQLEITVRRLGAL